MPFISLGNYRDIVRLSEQTHPNKANPLDLFNAEYKLLIMDKLNMVVGFFLVTNVAWAQAPSWTQDSERHVEGGDIVHLGTGSADTPDIALFKGRQMAIKMIVEECGGVANKDIVPRKQYVEEKTKGLYVAYSQVSLEIGSCEQAKHPSQAQRFTNKKIEEEQDLYDQLMNPKVTDNKEELQKLEKKITSLINNDAELRDEQYRSLETQIEAMKERASLPRPVVVKSDMPVYNTNKAACMLELKMMAHQLAVHMGPNNSNWFATPALTAEYNTFYSKGQECKKLK